MLIDPKTKKISDVIPKSRKHGDATHKIYSRSIVERVIREGKPIMMLDTLSEDEADRSESMELMRVRSVMCVPLISRSQIRGVIYVDSVNRPHGFRNDDLSLLTALSSSAAIAIENALLYAKEKTGTLH
jgi:GAF domain-containing protein